MKFLAFRLLKNRIMAIPQLLKDKNVKFGKKLLVVFGIIYLFLPVDLIPPILFPFGFLDDLVLWIWIIWYLKDTLDEYWVGPKQEDMSKEFSKAKIVEDVTYTVDSEDEKEEEQDG